VPEATSVAQIEFLPFKRVVSSSLQPGDWIDLGWAVCRALANSTQGVVIIHGTSTLEETAYFLHLTLPTDRPVVLTGSMRPASSISQDGDLNLLNAVRLAANEAAVGMGVLVVLNDEISSAREVAKTNTRRLQTFRSQDLGVLGYADADGRVEFYRAPIRTHTRESEFDVRDLSVMPRVDILCSYVGADETFVEAAVAKGAAGLVNAGTGAGMASEATLGALIAARQRGVAVVMASRTGSGRVTRTTKYRQLGLVAADNLTPQKARILLSLALTKTQDPEAIQRFFDQY
jgi:L-asparaginase